MHKVIIYETTDIKDQKDSFIRENLREHLKYVVRYFTSIV